MRHRHLTLGNVVPLPVAQIRVSIGATGKGVALVVGDAAVMLTPDRAEEYAVILRNAAIECRNGGALG